MLRPIVIQMLLSLSVLMAGCSKPAVRLQDFDELVSIEREISTCSGRVIGFTEVRRDLFYAEVKDAERHLDAFCERRAPEFRSLPSIEHLRRAIKCLKDVAMNTNLGRESFNSTVSEALDELSLAIKAIETEKERYGASGK